MADRVVLVEKTEGVAIVTLNRPEQLNAMNAQLGAELREAVARLSADDEVGCIVITGAGKRAFAAGGDRAFPGAGDHDAADLVIGAQPRDRLAQLGAELRVHRVELLGAIQGDNRHAFGLLDEDDPVRHVYPPSSPTGDAGVAYTAGRIAARALRSALRRRGLHGLLLQPLAQRAVGLRADHAVELGPVALDETDSLDRHVVDAPAAVAYMQTVVERDLRALPGHHLRAHGRGAPLDRLAEECDLLATGGLDLRQVGSLQEVPKERDELRLLLAGQCLPVPRERLPGDLVEIEHLPDDLTDLLRSFAHNGAIGAAVLNVHEACDRRFDGVTRSNRGRGHRDLGHEQPSY